MFSPTPIEPTAPSPTTLVASCLEPVDYRDAFLVELGPDHASNVEDFARRYFLNQPAWLTLVSMNTTRTRMIRDLEADDNGDAFAAGSSIGSWKIHERNQNEIVFGDDMGFMEYRFSFFVDPDRPNQVEASTAVRYKWRRTGAFYFALVKLPHQRFVRLSLQRAITRQPTHIKQG